MNKLPLELVDPIITLGASVCPTEPEMIPSPCGGARADENNGRSKDEKSKAMLRPTARAFLQACSLVSKQWSFFAQKALARDLQVTTGRRMRDVGAWLEAKGWEGRVKTLWASSTSVADAELGRMLARCSEATRLCWTSRTPLGTSTAAAPLLFLTQAGSACLSLA